MADVATLHSNFYDVWLKKALFPTGDKPFFHGDPHMGNMHMHGGDKSLLKLALLDFGNSVQGQQMLGQFLRFLYSLRVCDVDDLLVQFPAKVVLVGPSVVDRYEYDLADS